MSFFEDPKRVLLVAPNVSQHMGGEALKAFHIMTGMKELGVDVVQLTHARVRVEIAALNVGVPVYYIEDDWLQLLFFRLRLNWLLGAWGSWLLHRKAGQIAVATGRDIVHFTSPISPTLPYFRMHAVRVFIGPLNGNILHPPKLMFREVFHKRLGSMALWPYQKTIGKLFPGKRFATLLVSGGERTKYALKLAGCEDQQFVDTLDSGVDQAIGAEERLKHNDINHQFIFVGRLIKYKACDLVIRALAEAPEARLDVVGDGQERSALEQLAKETGVIDRVTFHGWVSPGVPLNQLFRKARGFIFPSLAEANGIVVQEAMMIGLPVVAVNWGGPQQLLDGSNGILIEPESEAHIIRQLAKAMNCLGNDPETAEKLAQNARYQADSRGFSWPVLLGSWLDLYSRGGDVSGHRTLMRQ